MFGWPVFTQCMAPLWWRQVGFASRSQSKSGIKRPLSNRACSNVHGHTGISDAKLRRYRSVRIQFSHSARGQLRPCARSHCALKYQPSGIGFDHNVLQIERSHTIRFVTNNNEILYYFLTHRLILMPAKSSGFVKLIWMKPNCMSMCRKFSRIR